MTLINRDLRTAIALLALLLHIPTLSAGELDGCKVTLAALVQIGSQRQSWSFEFIFRPNDQVLEQSGNMPKPINLKIGIQKVAYVEDGRPVWIDAIYKNGNQYTYVRDINRWSTKRQRIMRFSAT